MSSFKVVDNATSLYQLKIKKSFHIEQLKPQCNKQVDNVSLAFTMQGFLNYPFTFSKLCGKNPEILYQKCFNLLSLQIFFGFTFNITSTIFKAKTWERKLFCCQINQSRVLFSEITTKVHSYFLPYVLLIM